MNQNDFLKVGERMDDLQRDGLQIIQNPEKFCFGIDAVLLTDFVNIKKNSLVLDMCSGNAIIPILLSSKTNAKHFTALEIQDDIADMASRSVAFNHLEDKITIINGDIKDSTNLFKRCSFDYITVNPPYMNDNHGLKNPYMPKAIARHEILCTLDDILKNGHDLLKPGGHFFMIHRPFRLAEIMDGMCRHRLEPKRLRFVHPYIDKEPSMILIEGVRDGNSRVKVEPPIIMYRHTENK